MTVSLDLYRIRIGSFKGSEKLILKNKLCRVKSIKSKMILSLAFLLIMNELLSLQTFNSPLSGTYHVNQKSLATKFAQETFETVLRFLVYRWPYCLSSSALCRALFGNRRRLSYKFALWNCRKGLLSNQDFDTLKFTDVKLFIAKHQPHAFGIIESDIHSPLSRSQRQCTFSTEEVLDKLKIDGYNLELPETWQHFGQARILVYLRSDVLYKRWTQNNPVNLPTITFEVGIGKEKKTLLNYFYREWTSGVTGESSHTSQVDRLECQIAYWKTLYATNKDVVSLGDANLCALTWHEPSFDASNKVLANLIQDFLLEDSSYQIVKDFTRSEGTRSGFSKSCLDHVYTNVPGRVSIVQKE